MHQTPAEGARARLPHEYEASFAACEQRSLHVMNRLEYLSDAIEELADQRFEGVVAYDLPEDASAVIHLKGALAAAKGK
jgi:hypothetical protein